MNARRVVAGALMLGVCLIALKAPADGLEVGRAGDLSVATIEGCRTRKADDVRQAMAHDAAIAIAGSPSAPLTDFLNTIQRQLLAGYVTDGFTQAKVRVDVEPGGRRVVIRIEEGPRFTWGKIRLVGAKLTDEAKLRAALTEESDPDSTPATIDESAGTIVVPTWKQPDASKSKGKEPAAFEPGSPAQSNLFGLRAVMVRELFRQGLCWADVKLEAERHDDGTADLVIDLSKEGTKAKLRQAHVLGASINKPEAVLAYLGLHEGMDIDLTTLIDVRQKLWDSGRFLRHEVRADAARGHMGLLDLTIDLFEHPNAPPLDRPLDAGMTPAERGTLKLRKATEELAAGNIDYVADARFGNNQLRLVLQPRKGAILHARLGAVPTTAPATAPSTLPADIDVGVVMMSGKIGIWSETAGRNFIAPTTHGVGLLLAMVPSTELDKQSVNFIFGFGVMPLPASQGESPLRFTCAAAPVFFVDLARPRQIPNGDGTTQPAKRVPAIEIHGSVTEQKFGALSVRTATASGELLDMSMDDKENAQRLRVAREPGAFDREMARLERGGKIPNDYDPVHPVTSFARFCVSVRDALPLNEITLTWDHPATPVLLKILTAESLQPLDELVKESGTSDNEGYFSLPADPAALSGGTLAMARGFLGYTDELFPYGSWPWTLGHEGLLVATGGSAHADDELRRIMSGGEIGPVGCLAVAKTLRFVNADLSRGAAKIGLSRMSAADFDKDVVVLLGNDKAGAKVLANLLQTVSGFSEEDAKVLDKMLPKGGAEAVAYLRATAKNHPGEPMVDVLRKHSADWWEKGVKPMVEAELNRLAAP